MYIYKEGFLDSTEDVVKGRTFRKPKDPQKLTERKKERNERKLYNKRRVKK